MKIQDRQFCDVFKHGILKMSFWFIQFAVTALLLTANRFKFLSDIMRQLVIFIKLEFVPVMLHRNASGEPEIIAGKQKKMN